MLVPKRILVVAHDAPLRKTRVMLLENAGYTVKSIETDDGAMVLVETKWFDLILLGCKFSVTRYGTRSRIRERHPNTLTLKIETKGELEDTYPSRITDAVPDPGVVSSTAAGLPTGEMATFSPSSSGANGGAQTVT